MVAVAALAWIQIVAGCGSEAVSRTDGSPVPTNEDGDASSIEIVVVLPDDWPNPIYPGPPEVVVESADGDELRLAAAGGTVTVRLPAPGDYRVGAVIEDGGCFDTAGVASAGNPPVTVADGDRFRLRDTGEVCD